MLRISQRGEGRATIVQAEGRLRGPWVEELRRVLTSLRDSQARIVLDLAGVGYVDAAGEKLLREAMDEGARIGERSSFVAALLDGPGSGGRSAVAPEPVRRSDLTLVEAILEGDEEAFLSLAQRCHRAMVSVARCFVADERAARQVAQRSWRHVLERLHGWDGREQLECWVLRVTAGCAGAGAAPDSLQAPTPSIEESAVDRARAADSEGPGRRARRSRTESLGDASETPAADPCLSTRVVEEVARAIDTLPPMQRAVMTLRDVAGFGAGGACAVLGIHDAEQRVHLHRARSAVRAAVEELLRPAA